MKIDAILDAPGQDTPRNELWAVVTTNRCGRARCLKADSRTRVTRRVAKLVSAASSAIHSRVKASTTLSTRTLRPVASGLKQNPEPVLDCALTLFLVAAPFAPAAFFSGVSR